MTRRLRTRVGEDSVQRAVTNRDAARIFSADLITTLESITALRRAILVEVLANHLPSSQIAEKLGITTQEVRRQYRRAIGSLKHPSRSQGMRVEDETDVEELLRYYVVSGSAFGVTTEHVQCETHGWQEVVPTAARCTLCPCELPRHLSELGRSRRYCSNACRQKAYRQRKAVH